MKTSSPEGLLKKDYLSVTVLKSDAVETTCSCAPLTKNRNAIVIASVEFEGSPLEIRSWFLALNVPTHAFAVE